MDQMPANINRHLDSIEFTNDGGLFLSSSSLTNRSWSGSVWYYDDADAAPDVERCAAGAEVDSGVNDLVVFPNNKKIAGACDSGAVMLWELTDDAHTIHCLANTVEHDNIVSTISRTADNNKLISGSLDQRIKVWDVEQFTSSLTYRAHHGPVYCVNCHPTDVNLFLSAAQDCRLLLWDLRQEKPASLIERECHPSMTTCVSWNTMKEHSIIIGLETGELMIQDTRKSVGTPILVRAHNRQVTRLKVAPHKSEWVASASEDCKVLVTNINTGKVIFRDDYHQDFVRGLAWDPSSHRLFSCGWDLNVGGRIVTESESISSPLATMALSTTKSTHAQEEMDTNSTSKMQCNGLPMDTQQPPLEAKG